MATRAENETRDAALRPIIVHCIALLVQKATACDDDDAVHAAWNIFDYIGQPEKLPSQADGQ